MSDFFRVEFVGETKFAFVADPSIRLGHDGAVQELIGN